MTFIGGRCVKDKDICSILPTMFISDTNSTICSTYLNTYRNWINNNKLNTIIGLDNFLHCDYTNGTTEIFDHFRLKHKDKKFKFDNGEVLTLDVFDTSISKKILELCETCKADGVELYQRLLGHEAGRTAKRLEHIPHSDKEEALETIRKGFALTGIEPNVSLSDTMTVQDCNIIHRQFTTEGMNWGENPSDYDMFQNITWKTYNISTREYTLTNPRYVVQILWNMMIYLLRICFSVTTYGPIL